MVMADKKKNAKKQVRANKENADEKNSSGAAKGEKGGVDKVVSDSAAIAKDSSRSDLAAIQSDVLRPPLKPHCTISSLEHDLLQRFPKEDAETWDNTGLIVGNPSEVVTGIAVALDATVEAVRIAKGCNANVLLTHHPVFLDPPTRIGPLVSHSFGAGSVVWEAIRCDVALMNFHTALDVSPDAAQVLPSMLNLKFRGIVEPIAGDAKKGYGQLCGMQNGEQPMTLQNLAARCMSVFGRPARVWGDFDARMVSIVCATGSAGNLTRTCIEHGYDCLICGEVRYHDALAAKEAGLSIIELGHDTSELPLCALLAATLERIGYSEDSIKVIDQSDNWNVPEAIRV